MNVDSIFLARTKRFHKRRARQHVARVLMLSELEHTITDTDIIAGVIYVG